jgi:hypothetical protein
LDFSKLSLLIIKDSKNETESGDKKLKALYIATDNPSGLSLSDS